MIILAGWSYIVAWGLACTLLAFHTESNAHLRRTRLSTIQQAITMAVTAALIAMPLAAAVFALAMLFGGYR